MMIKRWIAFFMAIMLILPISLMPSVAEEYAINENGLIAWYDGVKNTENGHDANATVWQDLKGENDITVAKNATSYFTDNAYYLSNASYKFPSAVLDVINGAEFTVEMKLGKIEKTGSGYTTMINSTGNDNFSLFIRTAGDYLEFKSAGNNRPKYQGGKDYFEDSTVCVVFSMAAKSCAVYVDGVLIGSAAITQTIGAKGDLIFGHTESNKTHTAYYEGFRFYNRALTAEEAATNAKADGNYDFEYIPPRPFVNVGQNKTNIAGGVAFVEEITTPEQMQFFWNRSEMPAVAIIHTNKELLVTDRVGGSLGASLSDLLYYSDNTVIPAFYVKDQDTLTTLLDYLAEEQYEDFFVISDQAELVKMARGITPICRGIIDLTMQYAGKTDLTKEELVEIRKLVLASDSKVVLLPQSVANKEDIGTLCKWQLTPWVKADDGLNDMVEALRLLLSSAYGIVSDNTDLLADMATNMLVNGTLARTPVIIGHRGLGGITDEAPENTLESAILAYNAGANAIEFDVYLSKDGKVVANHNATTTNMANMADDRPISVSIESSKYSALQRYYYTGYYLKDENGQFVLDENGEKQIDRSIRISLLEDYLKYFKGKDVQLVIEIKSAKEEKIVKPIKELIDQYDMYDQVNIIAFGRTGCFASLRELYPEMNIGYLTDTANSYADANASIQAVLSEIQPYSMTYNPSKKGYDAPFVRAATYRGVTTWPWTFYNDSEIYKYISYGHAGITTDYATMVTDFVRDLKASSPASCAAGQSFEINIERLTYGRETLTGFDQQTEIVIVGGGELAEKVEGNKITLSKEAKGTISYIVRYTQVMDKNYSYTVYTQPIAVEISEGAADTVEVKNYKAYVTADSVELFIHFSEDSFGKEIALLVGDKTEKTTVNADGVSVKLDKTALDEKISVQYGEITVEEYSLREYLTAVTAMENLPDAEKAVATALLNGTDYQEYLTATK